MTFDWRAEAAKPGVELFDVEGIPVLGVLKLGGLVAARSGKPFSFARAVEMGAYATREEFEALLADSGDSPGTKS